MTRILAIGGADDDAFTGTFDLPTRDVTAPAFNVLQREIAALVHEGHEAAIE